MDKTKKQTIAVLSRSYSAGLGVIRSLGVSGYDVALIANTSRAGRSRISSCSKYVGSAVEVVSQKDKGGFDEALLSALSELAERLGERVPLITTDDYTTLVIDMNRDILSDKFILPTAGDGLSGCLTELSERARQEKLALAAGIPTADEWLIPLDGEPVLPEDLSYPCYVRPTEVCAGFKTEGMTCDDEDELRRHLKRLSRRNSSRSAVAREVFEPDGSISIGGICLDDRIVIPAIIKSEEGQVIDRLNELNELDELAGSLRTMLADCHYTGLFDMELCVVDGRIIFDGLAFHAGSSVQAYTKCGVNLPAIYAAAMLGEPVPESACTITEYGKSVVYERSVWDRYISGQIRQREIKGILATADITVVNDPDDPEPGRRFDSMIRRYAHDRRARAAKHQLTVPLKKLLIPILRPIIHVLLGYPQTNEKNKRDRFAEKPRALVTGRNYCSNLCMARSLGRAGYEVEVLTVYQNKFRWKHIMRWLKPDAYSKYVKAYYVCAARNKSRRIVARLINIAKIDDYGRRLLLVPVDDFVAAAIDENYDDLKEFYILPNVNGAEGGISGLMSKGIQKQLAREFGLPVLGSCLIRTSKGSFEIPDTVKYPCFIKPNISKNGAKGIMRMCADREELFEAVDALARRKDVEILVEDYAEIDREYSLLGLSTRDGVVGPGFFVADEGGQAEHRGVAVTGRILDCAEWQPFIDRLTAFIATLGLNGLFDIDLIRTKDGQMYFVEVNLRYGGSGYAVTEAGVNLPGMYADYMVFGKPLDMDCRISRPNAGFVSEKILIDEYAMGRLPLSRVKESLKAADISFVRDENDKKPYRHFRKFWIAAFFVRQKNLIKNRRKAE